MEVKRKLIVSAVGVLAVAAVGTGIAYAQTGPGPTDTTPPGATNGPNAQQGDQNGHETPDANEPPEAKGKEAEPANDPEPGHEDPDGVNVDHTPPGEQPEPESPGAAG